MSILKICYLILIIALAGCTQLAGAVSHGWEGLDYEGTLLPTSSPLGSKALENWRNFDPDVANFLAHHRSPDGVLPKSQFSVLFFYLKEDVQVTFNRPVAGFFTKITYQRISPDLREKLLSRL